MERFRADFLSGTDTERKVMNMKNTRWIRPWMYTGLCVAAIAGVSVSAYAATGSTQSSQDKQFEEHKEDNGVMAKIVSVGDDELTVVMAQKPADGETPPEKPADGETPPEKPADGETPPEKPADGQTPPAKPENGTDGREKPEMKFDTDTTTIKLTSSTVITKGMEHTVVSASSLSADSVVKLVLNGTTAVNIELMEQ